MKIFFFLFFALFGQLPLAFAKEPSFYEEFDYSPQSADVSVRDMPVQEGKKAETSDFAQSAKSEGQTGQTGQSLIQVSGRPQVQSDDTAKADFDPQEQDFILTDEKHARFLAENEQYALADSMLNLTWKELVRTLDKKAYRQLWKGHKKWLEGDRNRVAQSFLDKVPGIPEDHAFMLAAAAKTQELAQRIWQRPEQGTYKKGDLQVTVTEEEGKLFVQGYGEISMTVLMSESAEKTEKNVKSEKSAQDRKKTGAEPKTAVQKIRQLLFRAELPENGKLWLALTAVSEQKLYILTMKNKLCLVHAKNAFPLDFNGVFVK